MLIAGGFSAAYFSAIDGKSKGVTALQRNTQGGVIPPPSAEIKTKFDATTKLTFPDTAISVSHRVSKGSYPPPRKAFSLCKEL
jgi:hypothetical protein